MTPGNKTRERIRIMAFMLGVTFVAISLVSGAHLLTRDMVALNETLFMKAAILRAAGLDVPAEGEAVDALYERRVRPVENAPDCFTILDGRTGDVTGHVVLQRGAGLWGTIEALIGFDRTIDTLTGVEFVTHNETPGLGARIEEAGFRTQFVGKGAPFVYRRVAEDAAAGPGEFNAITGATITSRAVEQMLKTCGQRAAETFGRVRTE